MVRACWVRFTGPCSLFNCLWPGLSTSNHYTRQARAFHQRASRLWLESIFKNCSSFQFLPAPPVLQYAVTPASREAPCDQGQKGRKWHATAAYPTRRPIVLSKWAHLALYSPLCGGSYLTVDAKYRALPGVPSSYGFHVHVHTSTNWTRTQVAVSYLPSSDSNPRPEAPI